eukprot:6779846-Prymnesium_polylepis.1
MTGGRRARRARACVYVHVRARVRVHVRVRLGGCERLELPSVPVVIEAYSVGSLASRMTEQSPTAAEADGL